MSTSLKSRAAAFAIAAAMAVTAAGPAYADRDDHRGRGHHHGHWRDRDDDDRRHRHRRHHRWDRDRHHHWDGHRDRRVVIIDKHHHHHYRDRPWYGYRHRDRDRSDNDVAYAIGGLVVGMALGGILFNSMDRDDHGYVANTLETMPDRQPVIWNNPNNGIQYTMTPMATYEQAPGQFCREYSSSAIIGGRPQETYGTACRQPDGTWKIVR